MTTKSFNVEQHDGSQCLDHQGWLNNSKQNVIYYSNISIPLNLFPSGLWVKVSILHQADRKTVTQVSPLWASCAKTLNHRRCRVLFLSVHFPSYLLLMAWLLHCCTTASSIPCISSYITDLSQGSQVAGSFSCERGNTSNEVSQMQSSFFGCQRGWRTWHFVRNIPNQRPVTGQSECPLRACVLTASGSCTAVHFLKYVKLMNYWWLIR